MRVEEVRSDDLFGSKTAPYSDMGRVEVLFCHGVWVFFAPDTAILLPHEAVQVKMTLVTHEKKPLKTPPAQFAKQAQPYSPALAEMPVEPEQ